MKCYGPGWRKGPLSDAAMLDVIGKSKIVLGFGFIGQSGSQCLKGRDFEFPACGAVYLTSYNPELEKVYAIGDEIVCYNDFRDCLIKIRMLLKDEKLRARIIKNGRAAAVERHQWKFRFDEMISRIG